jgi:hypothetical protein
LGKNNLKKILNRRNQSVAFDRAMVNVHKNSIFSTLDWDMMISMIYNTNLMIAASV